MHPAYRWPGQPTPPQPARLRGRVGHQLVIGLALLTVGLLSGLTRSGRGLLAIGVAWVVLGLLATHRAAGLRQAVRACTEYAMVAALVLLVVGAAPAPAEAPPRRPPAAKAKPAQGDPLEAARARLADIRERLPRFEVSMSTKGGR